MDATDPEYRLYSTEGDQSITLELDTVVIEGKIANAYYVYPTLFLEKWHTNAELKSNFRMLTI